MLASVHRVVLHWTGFQGRLHVLAKGEHVAFMGMRFVPPF